MNENDDEIIVGVNIEKKSPKRSKSKKKKEVTSKKVASKERKNRVRISTNNSIFVKRIIRRFILIILIIIAIIIFLSSSFFSIKNINVINNEVISKEEIISLARIENRNIFNVNLKEISNNVKENSFIKTANVKRKLPNTIEIDVKERVEKYMIQLGEAYIYISNNGYILTISKEKKEMPIILGIVTDLSNLENKKVLDSTDVEKLKMVNSIYESAVNNEMADKITKIDMSNPKNYIIYFDSEQKKANFGDGSNINTRLLYIKAILEQEIGKEGEIFINSDLNTKNVYFREKV